MQNEMTRMMRLTKRVCFLVRMGVCHWNSTTIER